VNKENRMNRTASEGRSQAAFPARAQARAPIVSHILRAIDVEDINLIPVARVTNNLATQPRSILALLVYHYAIGTLASREIESALWSDAPLRSLCHGDLPDGRQLRRFRRLNHDAVQKCLAHVLAAQSHNATTREEGASVDSRHWCAEANRRLTAAVWIDSMLADE
jgi:hypothetical protein